MAEAISPEHRAFGQALRTVRQERQLSQQALAREAGIDRTYLGAIERGERNPSLTNLLKLTRALDIRLRDVAGAADFIAAGAELLTPSTTERRHPISIALERAAIALKGVGRDNPPISGHAAEEVIHDAARLVAELREALVFFESTSGHRTGVISQLGEVLTALERKWEALADE